MLEIEQRLVDQLELASLQCQAQIRLQLTSLLGAFVEAFLEEGVSAAAGLLGAIQRQVGAAQQCLAVVPVLGSNRDADAGRWREFIAFNADRLGNRREYLARQPVDRVAIFPDGLQDDELVPAEARNEMAPRRVLYPPPGFNQQSVAGRMAERVVDDLELVEVEAMEREQ